MYSVLHELSLVGKPIPAGFIHIPASHKLVVAGRKAMPSWSDSDLLEAVKVAISVIE